MYQCRAMAPNEDLLEAGHAPRVRRNLNSMVIAVVETDSSDRDTARYREVRKTGMTLCGSAPRQWTGRGDYAESCTAAGKEVL